MIPVERFRSPSKQSRRRASFTTALRRRPEVLQSPRSEERGGNGRPELKLEVKLAFNGARTKRVLCAPKVRIRNIGINVGEVHLVEQIECIGADFDPRVLTQHFHVWEPKGLGRSEIKIGISRSDERVPDSSWGTRKRTRHWYVGGCAPARTRVACNCGSGKVRRPSAWEVTGARLEGIGRLAGARVPVVRSRAQVAVTLVGIERITRDSAICRVVRESGVVVENRAEGPSATHLLRPAVAME